MEEMISNLLGVLFIIAVSGFFIYLFVSDLIRQKKLKKLCTTEVEATVVEYRHILGFKHAHYRAIYEYTYDENIYKVESEEFWYNFRFTDLKVKIKINPEDPEMIYDKHVSCNIGLRILNFVVVALIVGLVMYFAFLT